MKKFGGIYQFYYLSNSIILINDIKKQEYIFNWIYEKTNQKRIKPELIFRMSENGSSWEDFHKYCDDKGPTLILIETTKDKIFGGFTPLDWKKLVVSDICENSDQTFIFSLNLMKKFDLINTERKAIRYLKNFVPMFGEKDIALNDNMKKGITFANSNCNFLSNNNLELTGGKGNSECFETKDMEVFKIIYC